MSCHIDVRFYPAPPDLEGCFSSFYSATFTVAGGGRVKDLLQPEWANLRFFAGDRPLAGIHGGDTLTGARLTATGPSSLPVHFELGTTRMWGVGLFPLGWAKFCRGPATEMANRVVDGENHVAFANFSTLAKDIFAETPDETRELASIVACFRALNRTVPDEDRILAIHAGLVDAAVANVADFSDHTGLERRTLERLCLRYFGFPPKVLLRRQRFMRSLALFMLENAANWSDAMDSHYHDQAQFVREFRSFMGMSPGAYAAREHPILGAFMKERARVWGAAAQTLDRPTRSAGMR
ncbi:MAG: helix-turn-helix domain-containing protein [Candidatus Andeanibacterium colombiense]|uniref:Helix-turn-helix domain-containing protein n=1 Tax=Candidatus Andeanibacterium colombiense TaxID=3121345 RepID=A0AAJ5X4W7_9SPHN|nr:MAG: helix-turn-helix domain-containing protein [Sphingomonadaceae bacterium]